MKTDGSVTAMFDLLESGDGGDTVRSIVLSEDYVARHKLKTGDVLKLKTDGGYVSFKIAGTVPDMLVSGNVGIISEAAFLGAFGQDAYKSASKIVVKTVGGENAAATADAIADRLSIPRDAVITTDEIYDRAEEQNGNIFKVIDFITLLTSVIGAFGVVNNLLIGFMDRKKSVAVLISTGMSRPSLIRMLFVEAIIIGAIGGILGYAGSNLITVMIPPYMRLFEYPIDLLPFNFIYPLIAVGASIVICFIASLGTAISAAKTNVIETIKSE
jgi:putative ABC transport system permease protein